MCPLAPPVFPSPGASLSKHSRLEQRMGLASDSRVLKGSVAEVTHDDLLNNVLPSPHRLLHRSLLVETVRGRHRVDSDTLIPKKLGGGLSIL